MVVRLIVFLSSANLICRSTDISKCFIEPLGIRDNESRLYLDMFTTVEPHWIARTPIARFPLLFKLVFESLRKSSDISRKQTFTEISLSCHEKNVCCVYSLESPHRGDSNEYTQRAIIVFKIEKTLLNYCHLLLDLAPWLTLSGSNYPYLKQVSMVPKMFEPLKFDCIYHSYFIKFECQFYSCWLLDEWQTM